MSTDVIDRVLDPFAACLSPEVAQRIVDMRADEAAQKTLGELADKANEGTLNEAEQELYDEYRRLFHFVTILQAKARRYLQSQLAS